MFQLACGFGFVLRWKRLFECLQFPSMNILLICVLQKLNSGLQIQLRQVSIGTEVFCLLCSPQITYTLLLFTLVMDQKIRQCMRSSHLLN